MLDILCTCKLLLSVLWQGFKFRTGIVGIERNIESKQRETDKEVSQVRC